jgi:predicted AlkP superfamily pyrophosphatase or phosphodiesterase
MRKIYVPILMLAFYLELFACPPEAAGRRAAEKPKLVVIISIDQFRYDYLARFGDHFGAGGFNLFLKQGANFVAAHQAHAITTTAPGHSVITSGAYPSVNGIISNNWFDVQTGKKVYCVEDTSVKVLGAEKEGRSPKNFFAMTLGDVLKLSNAGQSKVLSVSLKDRSAILMGGKLADGAYWLADSAFVSSTYYFDDLPQWVKQYNASGKVNSYFGKIWERLLPASEYARQGADDAPGEEAKDGMDTIFPHVIDGGQKVMNSDYFDALRKSPFGNELLADFAKTALVAEKLGQRNVSDILCIGFSANDGVGHAYGPNSHEVMDMTIRTDRILEDMFKFIDQKIGLANCTLVLTGDHGVADTPETILAQNPNADVHRVDTDAIVAAGEKTMSQAFGTLDDGLSWIMAKEGTSIYLNPRVLAEKGVASETAENVLKDFLLKQPQVQAVFTWTQLADGWVADELGRRALRSFFPMRSGSVYFQLKPYNLDSDDEAGATHGSAWNYDSHVPLMWFGVGIKPGVYYERVAIVDIAPTLAALLQVPFPGSVQGKVLGQLLK